MITAQPWMSNSSPMGWGAGRIYYNSRINGLWQPYSALPDGTDPQPLLPGPGHRGVTDSTPDGSMQLVCVERPHWPGEGNPLAEPGRGVWCDVWLVKAGQAWQLSTGGLATMWAKFSADGTRVVWSSCVQQPSLTLAQRATVKLVKPARFELFGSWVMCVADLVWTDGVPALGLVSEVAPEPGRFYETYGFSPDGTRLLFASDCTMVGASQSQIWTCALDGSDLQRISPDDAGWWPWASYCEFGSWLPDGRIIFGRVKGGTGITYWLYDNGTVTQLTDGKTGQLGGLAVEPAGQRLAAGVAQNWASSVINAVMFTLP